MDDFRRTPLNRVDGIQPVPQNNQSQPPTTPAPAVQPQPSPAISPVQPSDTPLVVPPVSDTVSSGGLAPVKQKKRRAWIVWLILGIIVLLALLTTGGAWFWYQSQLSPVDPSRTEMVAVTIEAGSTPDVIADTLKENDVIKSQTAFLWYTRLEGVQNNLQAGSYRLSPSETTQEIVTHLVSGKVDMFDVTLYPGATLVDTTSTAADKKLDVTSALKRAGYTEEEIKAGLSADYSSYNETLFKGRPADADLEGYVFGDTYKVASDATVEDVIRTSFDHFWKIIEENNLVDQFEARGLTLYQGITLASIVQRESGGDDKAGIASVFYNRMATGQQLGSDVTYQYITDKLGVERDINFDSPYNTRRYAGLPPGPIATPGLAALIGVAQPDTTEYLFFLSGDDNITYYAKTLEEHEANIRNHCQQKCQII